MPPNSSRPLPPGRRPVAALLVLAIAALAALWWWRPFAFPSAPPGAPLYWGVNLAGGEFAPDDDENAYGRTYIYPDAAIARPFGDAGMNALRVPLRWERVQPWPGAMLSPNESKRLDGVVDALADFPLVILDIHNFGRYRGELLGGDPASAERLADLWRRLAERYRDRPNIAFGLMNEPVGIDARTWRGIVDHVVGAIRATGATNLILVPGTGWSGAHSWTAGGELSNAAAFADFRDPGDHFAFEMHQYVDGDSAGESEACIDRAAATGRLRDATDWLRAHHAHGFLGEFATGRSDACLDSLAGLLDFLNRNGDAWIGWTWWAAGPWWGDHWASIQPDSTGRDRPQMAVLRRYVGGRLP